MTYAEGVDRLVDYAVKNGLIGREDTSWATNGLLAVLQRDTYEKTGQVWQGESPADLLAVLCDDAAGRGLIVPDTVAARDRFDTALMGVLTPRPSDVIRSFRKTYAEQGPRAATDAFYAFCLACHYIRAERTEKDIRWQVGTPYGVMDLSINLAKPEKDPRDIAAAGRQKTTAYPACLLCRENEGYAGHVTHPARQNLRLIPLTLGGQRWWMQYSPYVYYNEHCILLDDCHRPMAITHDTFVRLLDFVTQFPHYMVGSNADLPIVGGSLLSHDHMQGGRYTFAMERAAIETKLSLPPAWEVEAGLLRWPLSVIRARAAQPERLIAFADRLLTLWRGYTDEEACIRAETQGERHHTLTPIARRRDGQYEMDLVLRSNLTTPEHPLGLYHPHAKWHAIKKENIGLIEVMGLAILPGRLQEEMRCLAQALRARRPVADDAALAKYAAWCDDILTRHDPAREDMEAVLRDELGRAFVGILEDCGVFKRTEEGKRALTRFCREIEKSMD